MGHEIFTDVYTAGALRGLRLSYLVMPAGMPAGAHTRCLRVQCRDRSRKKMRGFGTVQIMRRMHGTSGHMGTPGPPGSSRTSWPHRCAHATMRPERNATASSAASARASGGRGGRRGRASETAGLPARPARRHEVKLRLSCWGQGPAYQAQARGTGQVERHLHGRAVSVSSHLSWSKSAGLLALPGRNTVATSYS